MWLAGRWGCVPAQLSAWPGVSQDWCFLAGGWGSSLALISWRKDPKMALASTSVFMVGWASKMAAASVYVPRVRPKCLLPVSETLQDSWWVWPGSFQITASVLGHRGCEILCASFKSGVSISYSPLALLKVSTVGLQSQMFRELIFLVQDPCGWGAWCGAWTPHSLGRISAVVIILPFVGHPRKSMGLDYTTSLPFLIVLSWFLLCNFSCRRSFLLVFMSFSSIVAL